MRILVMGSGGVGGFFGGMLALKGHEVVFVARRAHLAAMRERGLEIRTGGQSHLLRPVSVVERPAEAGGSFDLVLFTVKGYDAADAVDLIKPVVGSGTAVLTLLNGVDSVDQLNAALGAEHVLPGVARIETTILEPGVIEHRGKVQVIELGEQSGAASPRVEAIATALTEAGAQVKIQPNPTVAVWEKFVMLAPNASLTSVCEAPNGPIRDTPESLALYRQLVDEVVAVGRAAGVPLPPDAGERAMKIIMGLPNTFGTSMQRDFERKNKVELEQLTGTVVRRGKALGVPTPGFDTVYAILKVRALAFGGIDS